MRRSASMIAFLGIVVASTCPALGKGPQPPVNKATVGAESEQPGAPLVKSAGSPTRASGNTAVSNAPIKSSPAGSTRGPIADAPEECSASAPAGTCQDLAKN